MKLSTRGRYSARLMLQLAIHYGKGPILLKDIAQKEEISEKYLGHLIPILKTAGLINSTRGAHGGYTLSRPPEKIKLSEVVRAVEGTMVPVECVNNPKVCNRISICVTREIWQEMGKTMYATLERITLAEMVKRYQKKRKEVSKPDYVI